jgi:hypothetical protein
LNIKLAFALIPEGPTQHAKAMTAMLAFQTKENYFELEHQHGGCDVMCKSSTPGFVQNLKVLECPGI